MILRQLSGMEEGYALGWLSPDRIGATAHIVAVMGVHSRAQDVK